MPLLSFLPSPQGAVLLAAGRMVVTARSRLSEFFVFNLLAMLIVPLGASGCGSVRVEAAASGERIFE